MPETDIVSPANTERTEAEATIDRFLLLSLIQEAHRTRSLWGKTKLEKLVYLSQYALEKMKTKAFNYYFYKWHYGPFSDQIYRDLDGLTQCGVIRLRSRNNDEMVSTTSGIQLLETYSDILKKNRDIYEPIEEIVLDHKDYTADEIKEEIYNTVVFYDRRKYVRDARLGEPLLFKLPEHETRITFRIGKKELESLFITLAPGFSDQISRARANKVLVEYRPLVSP
ncbi:Panacea domain-containing protein [Candidatus Bathyarchaeota archaeon]|nr:Panacea domain-containing protein [Candidatus Bathyarchaeota archaeon]